MDNLSGSLLASLAHMSRTLGSKDKPRVVSLQGAAVINHGCWLIMWVAGETPGQRRWEGPFLCHLPVFFLFLILI